jgi:hypothetical protein
VVEELEEKYPFLKGSEHPMEDYAKTPREIIHTPRKRARFNSDAQDKTELMGKVTSPKRHSLRIAHSGRKNQRRSSDEEIYESAS